MPVGTAGASPAHPSRAQQPGSLFGNSVAEVSKETDLGLAAQGKASSSSARVFGIAAAGASGQIGAASAPVQAQERVTSCAADSPTGPPTEVSTATAGKRGAALRRAAGNLGTAHVDAVDAVADPKQVRVSKEEHRQVVDLFQSWDARLRSQAQYFEALTSNALSVDTEISSNAEQVHSLRKEQAELQSQLEVADSSVHRIGEHQVALLSLLGGLQENLDLGLLVKDNSKAQRRTRGLEGQLEELSRQVRELAAETAAFQTTKYARPLDRVAHVLDAHSSELDLVQERLDAAERRLKDVTSKV